MNLSSHENTIRTHACFVMHGSLQQSEQVMRPLTMIMHFHSAVTESPGAIFTEISQWRWCYVTAAVDPAVHITNASHCGRVTCFIQAACRRQQQQWSSCYYRLASDTQEHAEPCSSHTAAAARSPQQPCSALIHSPWSFQHWGQCFILTILFSLSTKQCTHCTYRRLWCILSGFHVCSLITYWMRHGYCTEIFKLGLPPYRYFTTKNIVSKRINDQGIIMIYPRCCVLAKKDPNARLENGRLRRQKARFEKQAESEKQKVGKARIQGQTWITTKQNRAWEQTWEQRWTSTDWGKIKD